MTSPTTTTVEVLQPRVVDNDRDEITVTLDGKEIRGWSYETETERRVKMLAAREFCEGWRAGRTAGIEACVQFVQERRDDYFDEYGSYDYTTGTNRVLCCCWRIRLRA